MPKYSTTIDVGADADTAFGLLADFANAAQWDPATVSARRLDDNGPVGVGSRFELQMKIAGRENAIEYEITEFEAPRRVVLRGENSGSVAIDEITVEPRDGGSRVTYEADVGMKGAFKLATPLFGPVFKRMGDAARDRMQEWLDEPSPRVSGE